MKPLADGKTVEKIIPGLEGGTNWFPPAYDPSSGVLFVANNQWGMGLTSWEKGKLQYKPGDQYFGVDYQMYRMGDTIGHLKAIDIANKKVLWDLPSPLPLFSEILATKGGVVFTGDQRGRLLAYDSKTGKSFGSSKPGRPSTLRQSPTNWTESNMSRFCPGSAAIQASTIQRRRAGCCGCSRSTAKLMRAACTTRR